MHSSEAVGPNPRMGFLKRISWILLGTFGAHSCMLIAGLICYGLVWKSGTLFKKFELGLVLLGNFYLIAAAFRFAWSGVKGIDLFEEEDDHALSSKFGE